MPGNNKLPSPLLQSTLTTSGGDPNALLRIWIRKVNAVFGSTSINDHTFISSRNSEKSVKIKAVLQFALSKVKISKNVSNSDKEDFCLPIWIYITASVIL